MSVLRTRRRAFVAGLTALSLLFAGVASAGRQEAASGGSAAASCRGAISWQVARTALGRTATIRGRVVGTRFAATSNGSPTFLNIGRDYPNPRRFTVVIWIENRTAFGRPEVRYRGQTVCVRGIVESYRGVPEIVAQSPSQITVAR